MPPVKVSWTTDGVNGGPSSMQVLLDWLATGDNYAKWKSGRYSTGDTKEALCARITAKLAEHGITTRKHGNIRERIRSVEVMFAKAETWWYTVGREIADEEERRRLRAKKFPYYDAMAPVMAGTPTAPVRATETSASMSVDEESSPDEERRDPLTELSSAQAVERERADTAKRRKLETAQLTMVLQREEREAQLAQLNLVILGAQAREAAIHEKTELLLARQKLKTAGVCQEEIDAHLPLEST